MQEPNDRIKDLIIRHLKEELTIEEQLELTRWVGLTDDNRDIFSHLNNPDRLNEDIKEYYEAKANVWDKIDAGIKTPSFVEGPAPVIRPFTRRIWPYIAAASLLIIFAISYFWLASPFLHPSKARPVSVPIATRDVAPGGNKATLTLANGSTIVLENAANGVLPFQGSARVEKDKNSLSYTAPSRHLTEAPAAAYNTLTTPRAGQFRLVLPDGTKVWLNNASSLHYPTSFTGPTREVELTGEGYFEVAKNSVQPFLVRLPDDAAVQVLGTSFNVMAYTDEKTINTTLVDGSVKVAQHSHQMLLAPGEQGQLDGKGTATKLKVNVASVTAWKNGFFNFSHTDFQGAMRQLARWYDVDIVYKGVIPTKSFSGVIDRQLSLSEVLKIFESDDYTLAIEGKSVIVSANDKN